MQSQCSSNFVLRVRHRSASSERQWHGESQHRLIGDVILCGSNVRVDPSIMFFVEPERDRQQKPHHIGIPMSAFRRVLSQRAEFAALPVAFEASELCLVFKWLLRSVPRHSRRIVVIIDPRTVSSGD